MTFKAADPDHSVPAPSDQPLTAAAPANGGSGSPRRRGPKTPAGKERVSANAITHGLSSARLLVPGECSADWDTHRRNILDALAPVDAVDMVLAEQVASAIWRLRRVPVYEMAVIDERQHLEQASARLLPAAMDLDKIIRYEAHLRRLLYQALHELEARRAERRGQPTPPLRVDMDVEVDVNHTTGTLAAAESA